MKSCPCDTHQARMSELIDDGLPFPGSLRDHLASCPECAAFARFCKENDHPLYGALPSASEDLRQQIMRLPKAKAVRSRFPSVTLAAVAAAVLLTTGWWFTRSIQETPAAPPSVVQSESNPTAMEIDALKDDFDQALVRFAEPLAVFDNLARP